MTALNWCHILSSITACSVIPFTMIHLSTVSFCMSWSCHKIGYLQICYDTTLVIFFIISSPLFFDVITLASLLLYLHLLLFHRYALFCKFYSSRSIITAGYWFDRVERLVPHYSVKIRCVRGRNVDRYRQKPIAQLLSLKYIHCTTPISISENITSASELGSHTLTLSSFKQII